MWSEEIESEFRTRLKRSRDDWNRAQYLAIQGATLVGTAHTKRGIELCQEMLATYPSERVLIAGCWHSIGMGCKHLGDIAGWERSLRSAIAQEVLFPNVRTNSALELAYELALRGSPWDVNELEGLLLHQGDSGESMFPSVRFEANVVRVAIAMAKGDRESAKAVAMIALEAAGREKSYVSRHPKLGIVKDVDVRASRLLEDACGTTGLLRRMARWFGG